MGKILKPTSCKNCPINHVTGDHWTPPALIPASDILLVGEASGEEEILQGRGFVGPSGSWLNNMLAKAGIRRDFCSTANVIGCRPPDNVFPGDPKWKYTSRTAACEAINYCTKQHLWPAVGAKEWRRIIAIGDPALQALTGRKGILVWRGSPLPLRGDNSRVRVIPTLHPSYLARDSKYVSVAISDFRKTLQVPKEIYELYSTPSGLVGSFPKRFAFDLEWDANGDISLCGVSDKLYSCRVAGWAGEVAAAARQLFEEATDLIGHNIIGADTVMFEKLGWTIKARMHDTMLKQHLLQPDYKHDLGFVASVYTNKPFWKGKGHEEEDEYGEIVDTKVQWKTWDQPDATPRKLGGYGGCSSADEAYRLYNARDTDASFQINEALDIGLLQWKLDGVYWNVSVPAAFICRDIAAKGVRVDTARVREMRKTLTSEIDKLDKRLPEGLRSYEVAITKQIEAPPNTYKPKTKICKGSRKIPHEPKEFEFTSPDTSQECPECGKILEAGKLGTLKRIKVPGTKLIIPWNSSQQVTKYAKSVGLKPRFDRKRGSEAADSLARKGWSKSNPEFKIVDRLKEFSTLRNNFAKEDLTRVQRMFFNLLVHGTAEGRFASSGKRRGIDLNIQNQPATFRRIYIPDTPNNAFAELDYSGGENWLTAFLANDTERLARLAQPGYSEHLHLAQTLFGLSPNTSKNEAKAWCRNCGTTTGEVDGEPGPCSICSHLGQDLYDVAKHVNHGGNYGMTYVKQKEYCDALECYFSEAEHKNFIKLREAMNPGTTLWQAQTIALAKRDGFLRNPFGRMRWFSSRFGSTQALAFLPASTLADIIIRAMIAHYPSRFPKECEALGLKLTKDLLPGCDIRIQVHDSLVLHGPADVLKDQLPITKALMEQPWDELGGFRLGVEVKLGAPGASWGELEKWKC